jgi:hypothetical protein
MPQIMKSFTRPDWAGNGFPIQFFPVGGWGVDDQFWRRGNPTSRIAGNGSLQAAAEDLELLLFQSLRHMPHK